MRRLFVILSLFVAIIAMAGPVDKKQAMQEAAAFLKDHPLTVDNKADGQAQTAEAVRLTDVSATLPMGEKAPFYIINIGDQQGFVIVSGDDRTNPILGYSDEGAFDANRMPANMRYWLDCYAQQLNVLAEMDDMQAARVLRAPRRDRVGTHNSIAPLITTKWDQATPYWNELPDFVTEIDDEGIHWERLDEDVSLESFGYDNPEPEGVSRLFLTHPELNESAIARRLGIDRNVMRQYVSGMSKPSPVTEQLIFNEVRRVGSELASVKL